MLVKSVSWGARPGPATSTTIGEFDQGPMYRTIRKSGTPNFLLILTRRGSGRVFSETGNFLDTRTGDILLFEPGAYHNYGTSPDPGGWSLAWSHFVPPSDWDYWKAWPVAWPGLRRKRIGPITTNRLGNELHLVHNAEFGTDEVLGRFMLNCLQRAFLHVLQFEQEKRKRERDTRIQKALHYILQNLPEPLNVGMVAEQSGLSVSRFAHLFRQETGVSPQKFIETHRMELARNLLSYSSLPVSEVARACGFEDAFYFSSRFRKVHGMSPRAHREQP